MKYLVAAIACALAAGAPLVHAQDTDAKWVVKVGVGDVDPKSNNGNLASGTLRAGVGSDVEPIITGEYLFTPNWGLEVLASTPWEHDIKLNGAYAGKTKQLPPTVSAQYHFNPGGEVSPFVGLGINYTTFWDTRAAGPLAGHDLSLDDSWGIAAHVGVDFNLSKNWLVTLDARWIRIRTDATVSGLGDVGTVKIDPMVYGLLVGYRF